MSIISTCPQLGTLLKAMKKCGKGIKKPKVGVVSYFQFLQHNLLTHLTSHLNKTMVKLKCLFAPVKFSVYNFWLSLLIRSRSKKNVNLSVSPIDSVSSMETFFLPLHERCCKKYIYSAIIYWIRCCVVFCRSTMQCGSEIAQFPSSMVIHRHFNFIWFV